MKSFTEPLSGLKEYADLKAQLKNTKEMVQVSGCIDTQKPHFIYSLAGEKENCLIVTFQEQKARELYENYRFLTERRSIIPPGTCCFTSRISGEIC